MDDRETDRTALIRTAVAGTLAAILIASGTVALPSPANGPPVYEPIVVTAIPVLEPVTIRAPKLRLPSFRRAAFGDTIPVQLTQYCLQGLTRRENYVRPGIVAADPRVFPLAHHVEIYRGKTLLGKFLVDDTGAKIKGHILDIWTPSCDDARRFGRQRGYAVLVKADGSRLQ